MVQDTRIRVLNGGAAGAGSYVLYWMQASQRAEWNHALEYAVQAANERNEPVVVYFGITDRYPEANERHYQFMLEGLAEVRRGLKERNISMVIGHESPERGVVRLSRLASLVVCDRGYLRVQRQWRDYAARHVDCPLIQIESEVIVPVEEASAREEYAAATLRPKINRLLPGYLSPMVALTPKAGPVDLDFDSVDIEDIDRALSRLNIDRSVTAVDHLRGGASEARWHLDEFLGGKLNDYPALRNDPNARMLSDMSPYLHFGQISPLYIALRVLDTGSPAADAYLEELIVRRELSMNYVFHNPDYDSFDSLPRWAKETLLAHKSDTREYRYTVDAFEEAKTHDPYWNAAQREMVLTGKMHGYMRMYWGKKIIEWSRTPEEAFRTALYLNNKYELDGRDPNGYAGVAWCFGKHDRPWMERPVFGKVRYMNAGGLKRKFDADLYAARYK